MDEDFYGPEGAYYQNYFVCERPIMWIGFNPPGPKNTVGQDNVSIQNLFSGIELGRYFLSSEEKERFRIEKKKTTQLKGYKQKLKIANIIHGVESACSVDLTSESLDEYEPNIDENFKSIVERAKGCEWIICGWGLGKNKTVRGQVDEWGKRLLRLLCPPDTENQFHIRALAGYSDDRISHPGSSGTDTELRIYLPIQGWVSARLFAWDHLRSSGFLLPRVMLEPTGEYRPTST